MSSTTDDRVDAAAAAAESVEPPTKQPKLLSRKEIAKATKPIPCYKVEQLPPKLGNDPTKLYGTELPNVVTDGTATLVEKFKIPARDARSWKVPAGCIWRIVCTDGPQVADMNCWSLTDPSEKFYSSKTRQIHATHLQAGDRLWSTFPWSRPMATITHETIQYGWDDDGAGVHDVIGSRCDPYTNWYMTGQNFNRCCHSNLTRCAILSDKLTEQHVHDVLNVFMCTGFTKDTHQYFTKPSPVEVGDYIEFLAEIDLLVSASTCPQGDVSIACGSDEEPKVYPLGVEIYKLPDGYLADRGWRPSPVNGYSGNHDLTCVPIEDGN